MEKKDRRTTCNKLACFCDGMLVNCSADALSDCPKSRSRCIITSACWRVNNLKSDPDASAKGKSVSFEKVKGKKVA